MTHKELKKKIAKIVKEAIEDQMDWHVYFQGDNKAAVNEIMDLIYEYEEDKYEKIKR